jgi:hypothetical protein
VRQLILIFSLGFEFKQNRELIPITADLIEPKMKHIELFSFDIFGNETEFKAKFDDSVYDGVEESKSITWLPNKFVMFYKFCLITETRQISGSH